ncbi:MAG: D-glycerate dehydrogenase [Candidatus Woesearchaeota archaeon]|nr:MAG: D-glycerate dehydrogenase [Candidatus Woesearchaeota archaeon]
MKFKKLVILDKVDFFGNQKDQLKELADEVIIYDDTAKTREEIIKRVGDADAVITSWTDLDGSIIKEWSNVKYMGVYATGYGWIDVKTAIDKGITVTNVPHYATESVAELIIGNLIALSRNTLKADKFTRSGEGKKEDLYGENLKGKTIGIIGLGEIGRRVAELASAFGMNIIYSSRTKKDVSYEFCELRDLLKKSDVVSINTSLNSQTEKLLGEKEFQLMKDDSIFINFVHGRVVDETALAKFVEKGKIKAVIDDIQDEKAKKVFIKMKDRTVLTPHIGFYTKSSIKNLTQIVIDNADSYLKGNVQNKVPT